MQAMHDTPTLSVIASYLSSFNVSNPKKTLCISILKEMHNVFSYCCTAKWSS